MKITKFHLEIKRYKIKFLTKLKYKIGQNRVKYETVYALSLSF